MSRRSAYWVVAGVLAAGLAAAGALFGVGALSIPDQSAKQPVQPTQLAKGPAQPGWAPAEAVLDGGTAAAAADQLGAELEPLAGETALGGNVGAAVVELETGETVYETGADHAYTPASTMKILTAAAVLETLGPDHRFATAVTAAGELTGDVEITLVGGGDPLLASTGDAAMTPSAATLEELVAATADALNDAGAGSVRVRFDDGLFTGPAIDPDWRPSYVPDGVVAPVSALAVDGGRLTPGLRARANDPAQAAADMFAEMLDDAGIAVDGDATVVRADAAADAVEVASVPSLPLADVVEFMMQTSNNDVAEVLARHTALGSGRPGASAAASEATAEVLTAAGIDLGDTRILDGSGLARGNAVTVSALVETLVLAAGPDHPHWRPILGGLPVAGFSGTLAERVTDGSRGYVRAKTGTLTGVHSLAGLAVTASGEAYVFAVLADDADDALGARASLDRFAAALVS